MGAPNRFVTSGFGEDAAAVWHVPPGTDPAEVAGAYLQHRLFIALRDRYPHRALTARALAKAMNRPERSVLRLLQGQTTLAIDDIWALVAVSGVDADDVLSGVPDACFPAGAPPLTPSWRSGTWTPPSFARSAERPGIDWRAVATFVGGAVEHATAVNLGHLVDDYEVRGFVASALAEQFAPSRIEYPSDADDARLVARISASGTPGTIHQSVLAVSALEPTESLQTAIEHIVTRLCVASMSTPSPTVVVIATNDGGIEWLNDVTSGTVVEGGLWSSRFEQRQELTIPDTTDLSGSWSAALHGNGVHVLCASVNKAGASP